MDNSQIDNGPKKDNLLIKQEENSTLDFQNPDAFVCDEADFDGTDDDSPEETDEDSPEETDEDSPEETDEDSPEETDEDSPEETDEDSSEETDEDSWEETDEDSSEEMTPSEKIYQERVIKDFIAEYGCDSSDEEPIFADPPLLRVRPHKQKALDDAKNLADIHKQIGSNCFRGNNFKDAIHHYSEAIKCYDRDPMCFLNRAICYIKLNEFKLAEEDFTKVIQLDITCVEAYYHRATDRKVLKNLAGACRDLQNVILEQTNNAVRAEFFYLRHKLMMGQLEDQLAATDL